MKILTSVILLLLFIVNFTFSQWVQISTIGNNELLGVRFFNEFTGIVVGQGGVWRSTNSGMNWTQVLNGQNMNAVSFADINVGYIVGDSAKIYKTTNGGIIWSILASPVTQNLNGVWFVNQTTGYAVGQLGKILKSINGGSSWQIQTSQFTEDLNGVHMTDAQSGYIVGSTTNEVCAGTGNGGFNWLYNLNLPNNTLWAISAIPPNNTNVVAVGSNGRIRRSTSFGTSWTLIASNTTQQLNSIQFLDGVIGFIAGNNGTILKTMNSGLNWTSQTTSTGNNLRGINLLNDNTAWAVGQNGVVLRTGIPVGIHEQEVTLNSFKLYQNFPNPFNPNSIIRSAIPKNSYVTIKVYDLQGREISVILNNEFKTAGKYFVNFDGSNFASGVYFYRIEARQAGSLTGDFVDSKKMVLIK